MAESERYSFTTDDPDLMAGYSDFRDGDFASAAEAFGRSASSEAMYCLAFMRLHGRGVPSDPSAGADLLEKAADAGFLPAISDLAQCYGYGIGRDVDDARAFSLFMDAAEKGDPYGMLMVSFMYHTGEGTKADRSKSVFWCDRCESFKDAEEFEEDGLNYILSGDFINARVLLMRSAAAGSPISAKALEIMFRNGIGVSVDKDEAEDWAETADDCGWDEIDSEDLGEFADWFSGFVEIPGN